MSTSRYLWLAAGRRACHRLDRYGRERAQESGADARVAGRPQRARRSLAAGAGATPEDAANSYEAFLRIDGADPALKAQALRRLGDLRLEQAAALERRAAT